MFDPKIISDSTADGLRTVVVQNCPEVCSVRIDIILEGDTVRELKFYRGCEGNTKGIASLCKGMKVRDLISRLEGIDCHERGTSCPDQLAKALKKL